MDPFLGEIRIFAGNFEPRDWAFCNGQILPIALNSALFSLLGTNYGGNGSTTFGLPDLRDRVPLHWGPGPGLSSRVLGEIGGAASVALFSTQLPAHSHALLASSGVGTQADPAGAIWSASSARDKQFSGATPDTTMQANAFGSAGANQPHENQLPFIALNYIIATAGVYPQRS